MLILKNVLLASLAGGFICAIAQILINKTKITPARILVFFVSFGVFLYSVGAYEPLLKTFGCGVSLPLIGFGGTIGRGVKEAVDSDGILGALSGTLTSTSVGINAALLFAFILSLFFKGKPKRS